MEDDNQYPYKGWLDAEVGSSAFHPDAPKFEDPPLPLACRDSILHLIRDWIVQEQLSRVRRYGSDERLYNHQLGYMLCLSNLIEVLNDIDGKVCCNLVEPEPESLPDRDF